MGKFFNEVIFKIRRIPTGKTSSKDSLEELRRKFNEEQAGNTIKDKRLVNLAKAREAKKKKADNE